MLLVCTRGHHSRLARLIFLFVGYEEVLTKRVGAVVVGRVCTDVLLVLRHQGRTLVSHVIEEELICLVQNLLEVSLPFLGLAKLLHQQLILFLNLRVFLRQAGDKILDVSKSLLDSCLQNRVSANRNSKDLHLKPCVRSQ